MMKEDSKVEMPLSSPVKKNKRGQMIHSNQKILVINLYKDLKKDNPTISYKDIVHQLSEERGIGTRSVKKILSEYKRSHTVTSPNKTKHRPSFKEKVNECDKTAIRRKVHEFYFNKELPTLNKLLQAVNDDENLPNFKRTTFYSLLKELNFTYTNRILTERDDLIIWRRNYLRSIKRYREEGRQIYYVGETWINAGDITNKVSKDKTVKSKDAFLQEGELTTKPATSRKKKKGLIVLHIGSAAGFVPGGLLCFESKKDTGDHYDEINGDTFLDWFENILPLLQEKAVIVVNNAPYHSMKMENLPNTTWKKTEIILWLEGKGREVLENMAKAELLQIVAHDKDKFDKYVMEEIARVKNKKILRLPQYHCELNPIEMIWPMVKKYVRSNTTCKLEDVKLLVNQGIEQITAEDWCNSIRQIRDEEKKMWEIDNIADTLIDTSLLSNSQTVITVPDETDSEIFDSDF